MKDITSLIPKWWFVNHLGERISDALSFDFEGKKFIVDGTGGFDGTGGNSFQENLSVAVPDGYMVTCIATSNNGNNEADTYIFHPPNVRLASNPLSQDRFVYILEGEEEEQEIYQKLEWKERGLANLNIVRNTSANQRTPYKIRLESKNNIFYFQQVGCSESNFFQAMRLFEGNNQLSNVSYTIYERDTIGNEYSTPYQGRDAWGDISKHFENK